MELVALITLIALIQYFAFSFQVGQMRVRHGVNAPAMSGHPDFERMFRIQQNTMEQLVIFLPALWICAHFGDPRWAAGIGLFFIIGRFIYRSAYLSDPGKRGTGFIIGFLAITVLIGWGLFGTAREIWSTYLS
ncbi:MAG: MAPEG family protein [Woeseiaceae bacterium]|nr:MAPEG family protein [Woeseiaceae bacterium]